MFRSIFAAFGVLFALVATPMTAQAATVFGAADMHFVSKPNGTISATFGQSGIDAGSFTHTFRFVMPQNLLGSASVITNTVTFHGPEDLDIDSVVFNGIAAIGFTKTRNEMVFVNDVPVIANAVNNIVVTGLSRGNGSYGAQAVFAPVPEPASWAMMIGGFALVGGVLRRRAMRPAFA